MTGIADRLDKSASEKLVRMAQVYPPMSRTVEVIVWWYCERIGATAFRPELMEVSRIILPRDDLINLRIDVSQATADGLTKIKDLIRARTIGETLDKLITDFWRRKRSLFESKLPKLREEYEQQVDRELRR